MTASELKFAETTKIELSRVSMISRKLIRRHARSINIKTRMIDAMNWCCLMFKLLLRLNYLIFYCAFLDCIFRRISERYQRNSFLERVKTRLCF